VIVAATNSGNATVFAAFAVGFISFISPCVLPLVPGYLSAISGISFAEIRAGSRKAHVLLPAALFCLSFTVMFVLLGMGATGVGHWLGTHRVTLRHVSGIVIAAMGALFIATLFVPAVNREWRPSGLISRAATGGPVIAGLAFAVAWLPCTGPTLAAILTAAGNQDTVVKGGVLLAFYSLGLAVPFILCALAFARVTGIFRFLRDHYTAITLVSGAILVAMGVLLYTDQLARLNTWLNDAGLNSIGNL
jgi:cytochrome c-type biogenesis protein